MKRYGHEKNSIVQFRKQTRIYSRALGLDPAGPDRAALARAGPEALVREAEALRLALALLRRDNLAAQP